MELEAAGAARLARHWLVALRWIATPLAALPLLLTQPAPLEDWPNHIARVDILTHLLRGDAFWSQYYRINSFLLPNSGFDLGVTLPNFAGVPLGLAAQVFLCLTFAIFVGGGIVLSRAMAAADPVKPLLFTMLFYNGVLAGGFVNYMAGLGAALWILAWWIKSERSAPGRYLIAIAGCVLVFFIHLIAALFLAAAIMLLEFSSILRPRRNGLAVLSAHASGATAGAAVIGLLALSPTRQDSLAVESTAHISYAGAPSPVGIITDKLLLVPHSLLDGSGTRGALILLVGSLAFAGVTAWAARFAPNRRANFLIVGLNALWLVAPFGIGVGYQLDYRLVPSAFAVIIAATPIAWRSVNARTTALVVLMLLSISRTLSFLVEFRRGAAIYRDFERATAVIVPDSVLLTAIGTGRDSIPWDVFWSPPTEYVATLAVQHGVFVPTTFAFASQHTIVLKQDYQDWRRLSDLGDDASAARSWKLFDAVCAKWRADRHAGHVYVAVVYPSAYSDHLQRSLVARASGEGFRIMEPCAG